MQIKTSAPGKIILFGEHAVVYDKLGISTAVDIRANVTVEENEKDNIVLEIPEWNIKMELLKEDLEKIYAHVTFLLENDDVEGLRAFGKRYIVCGSVFLLAKIVNDYGFAPMKIHIESKIPKNLGGSGAALSATAMACTKFLGKKLSLDEINQLAYSGEVVVNGGSASGIDNSTSCFGGYLKYRKSEGITPMDIKTHLPIVVVESGKKALTGATVSHVRKLVEKDPEKINAILEEINKISEKAIDAIKSNNPELTGKLALENHNLLKKLEVSSQKLDFLVEMAVENGAYGAKMTGGGGGGSMIVFAKEPGKTVNFFNELGYKAFTVKTGVEGVKLE